VSPTHFLRDLQQSQVLMEKDRAILAAPLTPTVVTAGGAARLGILVTLVDIVASDPAMASCPEDWLATRDLALHSEAPVTEGPIVVDARLTRVGSTGVVVETTIFDGQGLTDLHSLAAAIDAGTLARAASGLITFARITRSAAPGMDKYTPGDWIGEVRVVEGDTMATNPLYDRLGARTKSPGVLELDCSPYVVNSIGTITGGAQAALAELAATSVVPDQVAVDLQMHFLAQVRTGPMRTETKVLRRSAEHSVVAVRLLDGERLLTAVTVTLAMPQASASVSHHG